MDSDSWMVNVRFLNVFGIHDDSSEESQQMNSGHE